MKRDIFEVCYVKIIVTPYCSLFPGGAGYRAAFAHISAPSPLQKKRPTAAPDAAVPLSQLSPEACYRDGVRCRLLQCLIKTNWCEPSSACNTSRSETYIFFYCIKFL